MYSAMFLKTHLMLCAEIEALLDGEPPILKGVDRHAEQYRLKLWSLEAIQDQPNMLN